MAARQRIRQAPQREARGGAGKPRDQGARARIEPGRHFGDAARRNAGPAEGRRFRHLLEHQRRACSAWRPIRNLRNAKSVDDLNKPEITIAYYTGGGEEGWVKERFPKAQLRGVAGSGVAPVEEVMAKRADAVPINRVPWVAMGRKLKQLAVLPKDEQLPEQHGEGGAGRHGRSTRTSRRSCTGRARSRRKSRRSSRPMKRASSTR